MSSSRKPRGFSAQQIAVYGVLGALAIIIGYVEVLFPLPIPLPGVKLGLGNVVVLSALVAYGPAPALAICGVKVVVSALLFGNPVVAFYSAAGALVSFLAMYLCMQTRRLSVLGLSMVGGAAHLMGQLAVVSVVLSPYVALTYAPVLLCCGLLTGLGVGFVCVLMLRTIGRSSYFIRQRKLMAVDHDDL